MTNWHRLHVPQSERSLAKAMGARFCWQQKAWLCSQGRYNSKAFERWRSQATWTSYVVFVEYAEREQAKRLGCRFSTEKRRWFYDASVSEEQLPQWIRARLAPPAKQKLRVPFAERHIAKRAGARWDADLRAWTWPIGAKLPDSLAPYAVPEATAPVPSA